MTHKKNKDIERAIRVIRDQMGDRKLTIISQSQPFDIAGTNLFLFEESIVQQMNFPSLGDSIVPGNAHFPVFSYIKKSNYDADYYWIVEYDVRFSGKWSVLFDHFSTSDADLLTSHIRYYNQEPDWSWWDISHPGKSIPKEDRIRSFNPVYRISSEAVTFLEQAFKSGWKGHNETIFSTLLYHGGYQLLDFGGNGDFSSQSNQFYISRSSRKGNCGGTMRYRPSRKRPGFRKNKLYHPVKSTSGLSFFRLYGGDFYRLAKWWISSKQRLVYQNIKGNS